MNLIIALLLSYLIGSIPTGYLIGKWVAKIDIRKFGSGNVGATNIFRTIGKKWGSVALIIDILKGFAVSFLVAPFFHATNEIKFSQTAFQLVMGFVSVAGHTWPIWLGFRGGKGVATSCGVLLGIYPKAVAASLIVWILVAFISKYVSLSSILAACSFPIWLFIIYSSTKNFRLSFVVSIGLCAFIIYTHRANIKRLLAGTENKIGGGSKRNSA